MKIALVHDYLIDYGGAERVLHALHNLYPDAPIYVSVYRKYKLGKFADQFNNTQIIQSWFGYLPFAEKLISPLRFLLPLIWSSFSFSKYDLIITSASWAVTKGLATGKTQEVCYLHTPPRYLYGYDTSRNWKEKWFAKLVSAYALVVNHFMRMYDFNQSQKVHYFIANSKNIGKRIEKFYRRTDYKVIYPSIEVEKIINTSTEPTKETYFLTGGRMVAAKNFDLIIRACKKANVKLKIFGSGIEEGNLKKISSDQIKFLGRVSDEEQIALYKNAQAFIVAQADEDFGITCVEAAAAGCPTIAYKGGGYLETVIDGKTGLFFEELTVESLQEALKKFSKNTSITKDKCVNYAKNFSKEIFDKEIIQFVNSAVKK